MTEYFNSVSDLMSTLQKRFSPALVICAEILILFCLGAVGQDIEATLKIESAAPTVVRVEGKILRENAFLSGKNWAFLRSIAGTENLGERIEDFKLTDQNKRAVAVKRLIAGEYLADAEAIEFSYQVNIAPFKNVSSMAHVSWFSDGRGLLMLDDLLPQLRRIDGQPVSARIKFVLPDDNWGVSSADKRISEDSFDVEDIEKAIFTTGNKDMRARFLPEGKGKIDFVFSGEFLFSDNEAVDSALEILEEYRKVFGEIPNAEKRIVFVRLPKETKTGFWEAETRGSTIMIISSDMPFKSQSVQRLHEQLRHELFHLWMPNNLALTGNYDWFYEGFALYQSLKTGVAVNRIRFEDFLNTLARAFDLDNFQDKRLSLLEASKTRWSGTNSQLYARGMMIAFLTDVALLKESKGKRDIGEILRKIYQKHKKPNQPQDGSAAIIGVLESYTELRPLVERNIKGAEKTFWQTELDAIGIETGKENFPTKLAVKAKLSGRQKDLLDKLGYNNWRKSSDKSK